MLALPPNVVPMNGVSSQSADAVLGAAADTVIMIAVAMMTLRNDMSLPVLRTILSAHFGPFASDHLARVDLFSCGRAREVPRRRV